MRILITGAGGNLGSSLADALAEKHDLVLSDMMDLATPHEYRRADLRRLDDVLPLARGCDIIVHTPAWHGMHEGVRSEIDFWQLNVDGTFHVYQSALAHGVRKIVWISSISIAGWERGRYGFSKFVGEHLCGFYHRAHGFRVGIIRPWNFTPFGGDFVAYGERLLSGGVDRRDVVGATIRAVDRVADGSLAYDWFEAGADIPFTPDDVARWKDDPRAVVEQHWPGYGGLLDKYRVRLPEKPYVADLAKTTDILGYRPEYGFGTFLAELRERDRNGVSVR